MQLTERVRLSHCVVCREFSSFRCRKIEYVFDFYDYKCSHIVDVECGELLYAGVANDDQNSKFDA